MNIKLALDELDSIIEKLAYPDNDNDNKLISYSILFTIVERLRDYTIPKGIPIGLFNQYTEELLSNVESMCRLNDVDSRGANHHISLAYGAVLKLRSDECFKIK